MQHSARPSLNIRIADTCKYVEETLHRNDWCVNPCKADNGKYYAAEQIELLHRPSSKITIYHELFLSKQPLRRVHMPL